MDDTLDGRYTARNTLVQRLLQPSHVRDVAANGCDLDVLASGILEFQSKLLELVSGGCCIPGGNDQALRAALSEPAADGATDAAEAADDQVGCVG